jgi:hypothetical protein
MPVTAMRQPLLAWGALVLAWVVADPAHGYTLTDWMRTWPTPWAAPAPAAPVVAWPTVPGAAAPAVTTPPSVVLPPSAAVTPPPVITSPPVVMPPPAATAPPAYVAPPATTTAPPAACGVGATTCAPAPQAVAPMTTTAPAPAAQTRSHSCCGSCCGLLCRLFHHRRRHQTAWARVPTTTFRPVVTFDPVTGATSTAMQPCTTYTWQVQRVPFFGLGAPQPFFLDGTAAPPGYVVSPAPGFIDSGTHAPATTPAPYYVPSTPPPATPPSIQHAPPTMPGVPGTSDWQPGSGADQRPALTPGEAQELQTAPSTSYSPGIPNAVPGDTRWPANVNPPSSAPVQPVPDPEARIKRKAIPATPARSEASDRTAHSILRPAAMLTPIVWPDQAPSADPGTGTPPPLRLEAPRIDNGQWRVVEP